MTAFDSVQNTAGGTAGDSDAAETSNEDCARAGWEQRGLRDILEIRSCACTGVACKNQVEAALAAVVAKNTGSICVNDALRDPYTSSVFDG